MLLVWLSVPTGAKAAPSESSQPAKVIYVSTGDNQWNSELIPFESRETVEAAFESMSACGYNRVYWRGEQDAIWLDHYEFRPENPRYWAGAAWQRFLVKKARTNQHAVAAAKRHGMEIYFQEGLFEHGCADASACVIIPYQAEDRMRIDHQEWIPVDRWGERRAPGPVEYAYPEARRYFVKRILEHAEKYDGVLFYTYVENDGYRYPEEFGFNEPVVREFKRRYGVDIRTQPFDKAAWQRLRGEYVTQLLRELHAALSARGKRLAVMMWGDQPDVPMGWQRYTTWTSQGPIHMDWETWVREGIVDEFLVHHYQEPFVNRLLDAAKGTRASVVVVGQPSAEQAGRGAGSMVDVWNFLCCGRYCPQAVTAASIDSTNWMERAQALVEVGGGLESARIFRAAGSDPNVLVRRQAVRTLAALKPAGALTAVEAALNDRETCVRTAAATALAQIHSPESAALLVKAVRTHGKMPLLNAATLTLKTMLGATNDTRTQDVLLAACKDSSADVREVAARALENTKTPTCRAALLTMARTDRVSGVRFYAFNSLVPALQPPGGGGVDGELLEAGITAMASRDLTVRFQGPRVLGRLAPAMQPAQVSRVLPLLEQRFRACCSGSTQERSWGWRVAGNAMAAFGAEGKERLDKMRTAKGNASVARAAYQVLYIPQADDGATLTDEKTAVETHKRFAP